MKCPSCGLEMERETVRYHTPLGYERKMVVYECAQDSCSGQDYTEYELIITELKKRLTELED